MLDHWSERYDDAPLHPASQPPERVQDLARIATRLFCSQLTRSRQSCSLAVGSMLDAECSASFDEVRFVMPPLGSIRLRPARWITFASLLWRMGYVRRMELHCAVKLRAEVGADLLVAAAREASGPVVLFGHGTMNRFLRTALRDRGWHPATTSFNVHGYWGWSRHVAGADISHLIDRP
jgi:hypothetical protein